MLLWIGAGPRIGTCSFQLWSNEVSNLQGYQSVPWKLKHSSAVCRRWPSASPVSGLSELANSRKLNPPKSNSSSRSLSFMVPVVPLTVEPTSEVVSRIWPKISTESGPSYVVWDCFSPEPLTLREARNEPDESFEIRERVEALGVTPGRCDVT